MHRPPYTVPLLSGYEGETRGRINSPRSLHEPFRRPDPHKTGFIQGHVIMAVLELQEEWTRQVKVEDSAL